MTVVTGWNWTYFIKTILAVNLENGKKSRTRKLKENGYHQNKVGKNRLAIWEEYFKKNQCHKNKYFCKMSLQIHTTQPSGSDADKMNGRTTSAPHSCHA